jgi:predicted CXXCH cytochrome family protein
MTGAKGVATVKAQPFRLEESKCWGNGDPRLTCFSCHDPHVALQKEATAYDHVCLQCHGTSEEKHLKTCSVAKSKCASCHMPKVYVPEMHYSFTDHRIRIVREGEPYPE